MKTQIVQLTSNEEIDVQAYAACFDRRSKYRVAVRRPRSNEADGTYLKNADGTIQVLGYSILMPDDLLALINKAWDKYCRS